MSELKTRYITDTYLEYFNTGKHDLAQIYLKSEVDKVLAEKATEIAKLRGQHQMLKRFGHYKLSPISGNMINHEQRLYVSYTVVCMIINHLEAEITKLKTTDKWCKVSEDLPGDGAEVLATDGDGIWLCRKDTMCDGSVWFQPDGLQHIDGITHWMQLPELPKEAI